MTATPFRLTVRIDLPLVEAMIAQLKREAVPKLFPATLRRFQALADHGHAGLRAGCRLQRPGEGDVATSHHRDKTQEGGGMDIKTKLNRITRATNEAALGDKLDAIIGTETSTDVTSASVPTLT